MNRRAPRESPYKKPHAHTCMAFASSNVFAPPSAARFERSFLYASGRYCQQPTLWVRVFFVPIPVHNFTQRGISVSNNEEKLTYEQVAALEEEGARKHWDSLREGAIRVHGGLCTSCPHAPEFVVRFRRTNGILRGVSVRVKCPVAPSAGMHNGARAPYNPRKRKGKLDIRSYKDCQDYRRHKKPLPSEARELKKDGTEPGVTFSHSP